MTDEATKVTTTKRPPEYPVIGTVLPIETPAGRVLFEVTKASNMRVVLEQMRGTRLHQFAIEIQQRAATIRTRSALCQMGTAVAVVAAYLIASGRVRQALDSESAALCYQLVKDNDLVVEGRWGRWRMRWRDQWIAGVEEQLSRQAAAALVGTPLEVQ